MTTYERYDLHVKHKLPQFAKILQTMECEQQTLCVCSLKHADDCPRSFEVDRGLTAPIDRSILYYYK